MSLVTHRIDWDLEYKDDVRYFDVPAGWPGAAAYASLRVIDGTLTSAIQVQRASPTGNRDFATARTLNASTEVLLTADDLQACGRLALVNPASQTCTVDIELRIERIERDGAFRV